MIERGDFVSPTFNYQPRLNKPVLSYWIVAGFYKALGVSVGVQRIPIALARGDDDLDGVSARAHAARGLEPACGPRWGWRSRRGS